jgi:hypothetical protein
MAQQPNLFPPNPPSRSRPDASQGKSSSGRAHSSAIGNSEVSTRSIPILSRVEVIVRIIVRLYLGLLILALPWLPLWTQNNPFTYSPLLLSLSGSGFFRGMVSGLGLLNIIVAAIEAKNAPELS